MRRNFEAFSKQLLGRNLERIWKSLLVCVIVFSALSAGGIKAEAAPFILFFTISLFSGFVMWQALGTDERVTGLAGVYVLPFDDRELVFSYVGAFSVYTLVLRTAVLLAVFEAVTKWTVWETGIALLCSVNACLVSAVCFSKIHKKKGRGILLWAAGVLAAAFGIRQQQALFCTVIVSIIAALVCLSRTDAYSFLRLESTGKKEVGFCGRAGIYIYLLRYLAAHRNYMANTLGLWGIACFLPVIFRGFGGLHVMTMGVAILSLNTPLCILLSCDPDLLQAVRALPRQGMYFAVRYCLFIFTAHMSANVIYLISWRVINGVFPMWNIAAAVIFALQSAVLSVLLEWLRPLRTWKIESDLWHHPRKYIVPLIMLFLAALVGSFPRFLILLAVLVVVEGIVISIQFRRE